MSNGAPQRAPRPQQLCNTHGRPMAIGTASKAIESHGTSFWLRHASPPHPPTQPIIASPPSPARSRPMAKLAKSGAAHARAAESQPAVRVPRQRLERLGHRPPHALCAFHFSHGHRVLWCRRLGRRRLGAEHVAQLARRRRAAHAAAARRQALGRQRLRYLLHLGKRDTRRFVDARRRFGRAAAARGRRRRRERVGDTLLDARRGAARALREPRRAALDGGQRARRGRGSEAAGHGRVSSGAVGAADAGAGGAAERGAAAAPLPPLGPLPLGPLALFLALVPQLLHPLARRAPRLGRACGGDRGGAVRGAACAERRGRHGVGGGRGGGGGGRAAGRIWAVRPSNARAAGAAGLVRGHSAAAVCVQRLH
ncbi:MAG: hypothetical protein J3K34DRAFT_502361, partial [Monoraphidium minutum]